MLNVRRVSLLQTRYLVFKMLNVCRVSLLQTRYLVFKMFLLARMNLLQFLIRVDQVLDFPDADVQVRLAFLQDGVGTQGVMPKGSLCFGMTLIKRRVQEFLYWWKWCGRGLL